MKLTILGSGPSSGIPTVHDGWGDCDPENPRNRRLRSSVLVENANSMVLVDTSPDLRQQLLRAEIRRLDAVLFTHGHADHLHGIDDLRGINKAMNAALTVYCDAETRKTIENRFSYTLTPLKPEVDFYYKPVLDINEISAGDLQSLALPAVRTLFNASLGADGLAAGTPYAQSTFALLVLVAGVAKFAFGVLFLIQAVLVHRAFQHFVQEVQIALRLVFLTFVGAIDIIALGNALQGNAALFCVGTCAGITFLE